MKSPVVSKAEYELEYIPDKRKRSKYYELLLATDKLNPVAADDKGPNWLKAEIHKNHIPSARSILWLHARKVGSIEHWRFQTVYQDGWLIVRKIKTD